MSHSYDLVVEVGGSWLSWSMKMLSLKLLKTCTLSKVYNEAVSGSLHKRKANLGATLGIPVLMCVCCILSLSGYSPMWKYWNNYPCRAVSEAFYSYA